MREIDMPKLIDLQDLTKTATPKLWTPSVNSVMETRKDIINRKTNILVTKPQNEQFGKHVY